MDLLSAGDCGLHRRGLRYLFNTGYVFAQELEWHLFALIFLLASGFTLFRAGHVRVDVIY